MIFTGISEFSRGRDRVRRFIREAKAASSLNHQNIITVHEIGEADRLQFIATEFIVDETPRRLTQRERLGLPDALNFGIRIAAALNEANSSS